jgi:hypothetical protein
MGYAIAVPLLVGLIALPGAAVGSDRHLEDFSRLRKVINETVYVLDTTGLERRLTVVQAGQQIVTLQAGRQTFTMHKDAIARVERARDRSWDGAIKGALFGLVMGLVVAGESGFPAGEVLPRAVTAYGSIGFLLDRAVTNRQDVYRAPAP